MLKMDRGFSFNPHYYYLSHRLDGPGSGLVRLALNFQPCFHFPTLGAQACVVSVCAVPTEAIETLELQLWAVLKFKGYGSQSQIFCKRNQCS